MRDIEDLNEYQKDLIRASLSPLVEREPNQQCDKCGKIAELRPYGENGACICVECAHLNPQETERRMGMRLFGDTP